MNTLAQLIFVAATMALTSAYTIGTKLRGTHAGNGHPIGMEKTACTLLVEESIYEPSDEQPDGFVEEKIICQLPQEDPNSLRWPYLEIIDATKSLQNVTIIPGQTTLTATNTIIDETQNPRLFIPINSDIQFSNTMLERNRRDLATRTTGSFNVLAIRVVDSNGIGPTPSVSKMVQDIFKDESCLKSQLDACSYGKVNVKPYEGETKTGKVIKNGVLELNIDFDLSKNKNWEDLRRAAEDAAQNELGKLRSNKKFDNVLFCLPPGSDTSRIAIASGSLSFYRDTWCSSVSAQMHEVGHSFGLSHSGTPGNIYGDNQGAMGVSHGNDDQQICYNAAKNYQLGWYNDQVETVNPLSSSTPISEFILNGVSDYNENSDALLVLRLEQTSSSGDFYIGYNRKDGINADTKADGDMVTILHKNGDPFSGGSSTKVAGLQVGSSYVIENFNEDRGVEIRFVGVKNNFRDAIVQVIDVQNAPEEPHGDVGACNKYMVEVKTDKFPKDNYWVIQTVGGKVAVKGPELKIKNNTYKTEICLPVRTNYEFLLFDKYGDGICCGKGNGSYRISDSFDNTVVLFEKNSESFELRREEFRVGKPIKSCDDKKGKFKWKDNKKKNSCKQIAKKGKCDEIRRVKNKGTKPLWKFCPDACGRCGDL